MKLPGSNLVTRVGIILLTVLILVAAYLKIAALEAFLIVLWLLCLLSYFWARYALSRIELEIEQEDCRAFPGETMELEARLKNNKLLPLIWLKLNFPTAGRTCVEPAEPYSGGIDAESVPEISGSFMWVMPYQSVFFKQRVRAVHRGVCTVSGLKLSSGDGFGLTVQERDSALAAAFRFVVYPAIKPADVSLILNNMSEMEPARDGFYTDKTLLRSTRAYRDGDSFKSINWRLMARQEVPQVNVYEKISMHRVCFLPDVQSFTFTEEVDGDDCKKTVVSVHKDEMERMFSTLASVIMRLNERGVLCSLVVPSIGETEARIIVPETQDMQAMLLLTALAEIEYEGEPVAMPVDAMTAEHHKLGQIYMLSSSPGESAVNRYPELIDELSALQIVQSASEEELLHGRRIFKETDFTAI